MARAHALMVPRDPTTGAVLSAATINVYVPGSTTFIPVSLFDRGGVQLSNPLTSDPQTGLVDFYLNVAQDVDLNVVKTGFITRTYFNVPVLDDASNELSALLTTTGDIVYASANNTPATLHIGTVNSVLRNIAGVPTWGTTLTGLTLTAPFVSDFTNAAHVHDSAAHGGQVSHFNLGNIGTNTHTSIDAHIASPTAHGTTGAVVGTTDTQTLSNKTLTSPVIGSFANAAHAHANGAGGGQVDHVTLQNIGAYNHGQVDTHINASVGAHGITSTMVGTDDTQTLTNKTMVDPISSGQSAEGSGRIAQTGTIPLPTAVDGRHRHYKALGGSLTFTGTSLVAPGGLVAVTSFTINPGDSVTLWADSGTWFGL